MPAHLSWMFDAMRFTHATIRNLVALGTNSPSCVDALALARQQLEALYSVCLMVQDPSLRQQVEREPFAIIILPCSIDLFLRTFATDLSGRC